MSIDETLIGDTISVERKDHVLQIGLNRPDKKNAFNLDMLGDLSLAYALLEEDPDLRVGLLFAHGETFTSGLDLMDVAPAIFEGRSFLKEGGVDPLRLEGSWTKPVVAVAQGWVMTVGIELLLAADIRICSNDVRFAQIEVNLGIYPFGGATFRFPELSGWGNAMRWMLTGDEFGADEAHRIGLVQEVESDADAARAKGLEIASRIASDAAPLGVRKLLASAHLARNEGPRAAVTGQMEDIKELFQTKDAAEGLQSFIERRKANFTGEAPNAIRPQ